MTTPVRHTECGGIAMWYVGQKTQTKMRSRDVVYLDGSRPKPGDAIPNCPSCGKRIGGSTMRCFDEDLDPGAAVKAAIKKITT